MLAGEIPDDADKQIDAAVAAAVARRADDHRHAETARREQHLLQFVDLPLARTRRDIGAERARPDIARPGIRADHIRLAAASYAEATGLDRRKAEMAVRTDIRMCVRPNEPCWIERGGKLRRAESPSAGCGASGGGRRVEGVAAVHRATVIPPHQIADLPILPPGKPSWVRAPTTRRAMPRSPQPAIQST